MSVAPLRFVFVIGCQRSGTTLTGQILGAHPNAVLLDEPDGIYPWFAALDPKDPFGGDGLSAVLEKAATKYADPEQRFWTGEDWTDTALHNLAEIGHTKTLSWRKLLDAKGV